MPARNVSKPVVPATGFLYYCVRWAPIRQEISGGLLKRTSGNHDAEFARAQRHLARRDPVLRRLIARIGACTLRVNPDGFEVLARSIISQQISWKAAISIGNRLSECLGKRGLSPAAIVRASETKLRAAGLSANKMRALKDLAGRCKRGELILEELPSLHDEEVIERLLPVYGIGRWTAEMFLIFSLGRLDVLPLADLGLRAGIQRQYELPDMPLKEDLIQRAEPWRPFRSVATWFIWRSFGNVPQSS
jgi:DNA-3-methyladenine glycosylase II